MILCRVPAWGSPQYYDISDSEVNVYKVRDSIEKAVVPRKPRSWRWSSMGTSGVSAIAMTRLEAAKLAASDNG